MQFSHPEADKLLAGYASGKFTPSKELDGIVAAIRLEMANPTVKIADDPHAVYVPMGSVAFTTSFSQSSRLKTVGLGSCLALVTHATTEVPLLNLEYTVGSLTHAAATLNTVGLISEIVHEYSKRGILPHQIDFEIHATGSVDKNLLAEVKRIIHAYTGTTPIKEEIRTVHSKDFLYDFGERKGYEITKLDLSLPEYKNQCIPGMHANYIKVHDERTQPTAIKMMSGLNYSKIVKKSA